MPSSFAPISAVGAPARQTNISFFVAGEPRPQPRARAFALRGRGGRVILSKTGEPIIRMHEAGTAEFWKGQVASAAKEHCPFKPLQGALKVNLDFFLPRPKTHYRTNGALKPSAPKYHTSRGDVDNLFKAVTDALTVLGMWEDDGQIAVSGISKLYTVESTLPGDTYGTRPGCYVSIEAFEDQAQPKADAETQPEML